MLREAGAFGTQRMSGTRTWRGTSTRFRRLVGDPNRSARYCALGPMAGLMMQGEAEATAGDPEGQARLMLEQGLLPMGGLGISVTVKLGTPVVAFSGVLN